MKTKILLALLALGLTVSPRVALADAMVTYNTLAAGGNGFYNGSGNIDGSFTTTTADYGTAGSIGLSLRGADRHVGPIAPTGNNDYVCSGTEQCNFEWSVATTGSFTIGSFTYDLTVSDLTTAKSFDFTSAGLDPSGLTGLDDSYEPGGKKVAYSASFTGFENSEYLGFGFLGLGWNSTDQVVATLSATPKNTSLTDPSVTIGFNDSPAQVPEPTSIALALTVAGLCFNRLRRRQQA
jgi:hypothetical protein